MSVELPPPNTKLKRPKRFHFIFKFPDLHPTLQSICCKPVGLLSVSLHTVTQRWTQELSDLLQNISQVPRAASSMQCHVPRQIFPTRTCVTAAVFLIHLLPGREAVSPSLSLTVVECENCNTDHHSQISLYFPISTHHSSALP